MSSTVWVVDSGASAHFSAVRDDFITLDLGGSGTVSGISVCVRGRGTCRLTLIDTSGRKCIVTLDKVMFVTNLVHISNGHYRRMVSVPVATNRGYMFEFTQSGDKLWTPKGRLFDMIRSNILVWLPTFTASSVPPSYAFLSKLTECDTIHRRCAHVSEDTIRKMSALGIKGIPKNYSLGISHFCKSCAVNKSTTSNINRVSTRDHDPESCFHTLAIDIWGPVKCPSIGNFSYVLGGVCLNLRLLWPNYLSISRIRSKYFAVFSTRFNYSGTKYECSELAMTPCFSDLIFNRCVKSLT
jgi:hypothetical protein